MAAKRKDSKGKLSTTFTKIQIPHPYNFVRKEKAISKAGQKRMHYNFS